ncbi:MAG: hypothetical protein AVDCRST_MAG77-3761 [uncultured Chloroflexi bacterium]|uniref:Uncharacterized protein n=1 Tax=uncultured Chloroflexota bacterium TaxID=166587 RepID=A0A6J4J639_9CHLR|nr:MAG: hypothetical protein AVDCRST_MAG77-3761 [uncultured Chloroflexota bacterium]
MPSGGPSPFAAKIPKSRQKDLAKRLRRALSAGPMDMQRMTDVLEIEPEEVVTVLRRLRSRRRGRLHTGIRFGHVCWWWEPARARTEGATQDRTPRGTPEPAPSGKKRKKERAPAANEGGVSGF